MAITSIDKTRDLGTKSISKLLLSYFFTALIGMTMNTVYNLTDTLFISRGVGDLAMGGVSIIVPFVLFQGGVSTMIGGGAATLVSIKLGQEQPIEAGRVTFNAMTAFYTVAIIITIIGLVFRDSILVFLGATGDVYDYAREYFTIILIGNVFSTGFSSIIRAEGKNVYGMLIWIVPITINIILDAIFIFVLNWGVKGAALATVISQLTSFVFSVVFFARFSSQQFRDRSIRLLLIGEIITIGLPVLAQVSAFSVITTLVNVVVGRLNGDNAIIAFGYVSKLIYYAIVPLLALSTAMSPIISYNYAQRDDLRKGQTLKIGTMIAIIYAIAIVLVCCLMPTQLLNIFTDDVAIISLAKPALMILSGSLFFMEPQIIVGTMLQAEKKTCLAVFVNLESIILAIPLVVLLPYAYNLLGVWIGYVLAYAISSISIVGVSVINIIRHKRY